MSAAADYPHIGQRVECIRDVFPAWTDYELASMGLVPPVVGAKYTIRDIVPDCCRRYAGLLLIGLVNPPCICPYNHGPFEPCWPPHWFRPIGGTEAGMTILDRARRAGELRRLGMDILDPVR